MGAVGRIALALLLFANSGGVSAKKEAKKGKGSGDASAGGAGGAGGMPDLSNMGEMMFNMMDKNGDGILTKKEMASLGDAMGGDGSVPKPKKSEADQMFKQMDADGDGKVTRKEADKVFDMMKSMMGGGGIPGMGGGAPGMGGMPGLGGLGGEL